jgi:superfamily I DNA and/or RNA helicase
MRDAIKEYSQSLAATNQVAGGRELMKFNMIENVILEEAARSNPLDLLIPIIKATRRIILVGDQKQLPQLIETNIVKKAVSHIEDEAERNAESLKFEDSLFKILFDNLGRMDEEGLSGTTRRSITLEEQFRMHPAIGDFISRLYYSDRLKPGMGWEVQEAKRRHGLTIPWAAGKVAVFCDVPREDGFESGRRGKARRAEANRVISLLDELGQDPAFDDLSIGIITFYSSQVDMIFEEGMRAGYTRMNKDGDYEIAPDYLETKDHREKLRIGSVDSFQGKEFDIVILSTVRCNDFDRTEGNERSVFGFLTLFNRLNVAFSRAQRMIIVAGDGQMFDDEYAKTHVEGLYEFYNVFSRDEKYGSHIR